MYEGKHWLFYLAKVEAAYESHSDLWNSIDEDSREAKAAHVHLDPEFETFTYGDPTAPKRLLRTLEKGDYLIFYCGLEEWDETTGWKRERRPALYIVGYFEVEMAGMATNFSKNTLQADNNGKTVTFKARTDTRLLELSTWFVSLNVGIGFHRAYANTVAMTCGQAMTGARCAGNRSPLVSHKLAW